MVWILNIMFGEFLREAGGVGGVNNMFGEFCLRQKEEWTTQINKIGMKSEE